MGRPRGRRPFGGPLGLAAGWQRWLPAALAGCVIAHADPLAERFTGEILPVLQNGCVRCHGNEKAKGGVNFETFTQYEQVLEHRALWTTVLERVQADEMPPSGAPPLGYSERQTLMTWLRQLPAVTPDCDKLASDRTQSFYRGYVMSRRLTRAEYENSLRDLLGVAVDAGRLLPADGAGGEGFDNTGDTLFTSSLTIERYLEAADQALRRVLPDDPSQLDPASATAREALLAPAHEAGAAPRDAARQVISRFARRAWRRSVDGTETDRLVTLFDRAFERGDGFDAAVRLALKGVLVSPHFLFLAEPEPEATGIVPLAPFPLASRLAFFLWASLPDEELLAAAESGALQENATYLAQVRRMLQDPRADAFGERFALQWLKLDGFGRESRPDPRKFPEFDDALADAMRQEVVSFFNHLVREDRPLLDLIDADYTFANDRLAALYGLPAPGGPGFQKISLTAPERGGVLGMAAVHTATSYPFRTSPVLRGKWVLEVVLGDRMPPPPANVPALEIDEQHVTAASLREKLEQHRRDPSCAACHDRMDPLGFGLESFDVLGRLRDGQNGEPVDASGTLPSGEHFTGPAGLKAVIRRRQDPVLRHLVRQMTGYAFGRELNRFDECVIRDAMKALADRGYRASALIETLATSFPFRHRFYAAPESPEAKES
ncbi:MAG: DUF1592 domain-containing protein [Verrucomicrobiales bacterium]|nr:DUF1592 domain-containing protein [Verrucomicrobiales bacterium]